MDGSCSKASGGRDTIKRESTSTILVEFCDQLEELTQRVHKVGELVCHSADTLHGVQVEPPDQRGGSTASINRPSAPDSPQGAICAIRVGLNSLSKALRRVEDQVQRL